jgi:hypothetical protein
LRSTLPCDAWTRRPGTARWSPAECVAHLNLTSEALLPLLRAGLEEAGSGAQRARSRHRRDLVGWVIWKVMAPSGRLRTRTLPAFVPAVERPPETLAADFERLQSDVISCVRAAEGLPIDHIKLVSPFDARLPAYPSEDAVMSGVTAELLKLLFPAAVKEDTLKAGEQRQAALLSGKATASDRAEGRSLDIPALRRHPLPVRPRSGQGPRQADRRLHGQFCQDRQRRLSLSRDSSTAEHTIVVRSSPREARPSAASLRPETLTASCVGEYRTVF